MPSDALLAWQTDRMPRLQKVEDDCIHLEALHPADAGRVQEFIRSYAVLLFAEFQGFCRDLHDECAEKFVDSVNPAPLRDVLRSQCVFRTKLDTSNPNPDSLREAFTRYGFDFGSMCWQRIPPMRREKIDLPRLTLGGTRLPTTILIQPNLEGRRH